MLCRLFHLRVIFGPMWSSTCVLGLTSWYWAFFVFCLKKKKLFFLGFCFFLLGSSDGFLARAWFCYWVRPESLCFWLKRLVFGSSEPLRIIDLAQARKSSLERPIAVQILKGCCRHPIFDRPQDLDVTIGTLGDTLVRVRLQFPEVSVACLASGSRDSTVRWLVLHQTLVVCLGGAGNAF